jgi:DNA (cytosine-5)-methyltransferase 1
MVKLMNGLDLFSGIGGISLALSDYVKTIGYVEIDKYAQSVLLSRMLEGKIETAPIFRDITRLNGNRLRGNIDIISGGFPCQDISVAGRGAGLAGKRSGLFYEVVRLTEEIRPTFIFLENVPAIRTRGLEQVIKAFTEVGYDCRWTMLTAASVGANHKRERWFLLAHDANTRRLSSRTDKNIRLKGEKSIKKNTSILRSPPPKAWNLLAYAKHNGRAASEITGSDGENHSKPIRTESQLENTCNNSWWAAEPNVGRVVDELPYRVDRIKCLGNSVVPLQVKKAFQILLGIST